MKRLICFLGLICLLGAGCTLPAIPAAVQATNTTVPQVETPIIVEVTITNTPVLVFTPTETSTAEAYPSPVLETAYPAPDAAVNTPEAADKTLVSTPEAGFRNLVPDAKPEGYGYRKQSLSPAYLPNFAHPESGCNWLGVAGQVFDADGMPLGNLVVVVEGEINGAYVEALGFTGLAKVYGPEGYEILLNDQAVAGNFWLQVFDLQGNALSDIIPFSTTDSCEENLVLVSFYYAANMYESFIPVITK